MVVKNGIEIVLMTSNYFSEFKKNLNTKVISSQFFNYHFPRKLLKICLRSLRVQNLQKVFD